MDKHQVELLKEDISNIIDEFKKLDRDNDFGISQYINEIIVKIKDLPGLTNFLNACMLKRKTTVYVHELRAEGFSDDTIRQLTCNLPNGWGFSGPSADKLENAHWLCRNFPNLIKMKNGAIAHYFYFSRGEMLQ